MYFLEQMHETYDNTPWKQVLIIAKTEEITHIYIKCE